MTIKHLVIPGGGPTGIQALGALQFLEKNEYWNIKDIETIYATSAGAILSLLIALKFDWDTINNYILYRPWHETYHISVTQILEAYSKKGIFDKSIVEIFYKPFFDVKDLPLTMTMKEFYEYSNIELHFFSLELNSFEIVDISYKTFPDIPVIDSVLMSCAIPMIICPVCIDKKCFVDGGVVTNYPIHYCLENKNVDEILGIQNIYEKRENSIINQESTILDYIIMFISKLIEKASSYKTEIGLIPNELTYTTQLLNLSYIKDTMYSIEKRKKLLDMGLKSGEEFLLNNTSK